MQVESFGWDDEANNDCYFNNKNIDKNIIKMANDRFSLRPIFDKYEINFSQQYSPSGWTYKAICPFKDHNEKTPSFGYNPNEERFNCFGCQRSGKAVQFLSYMEGKPTIQVARELLRNILVEDELNINDSTEEYGKIFELLMKYANDISSFVEDNNNDIQAIKYAETISWVIDAYIRNHLPRGTVILEQLSGRIDMLQEHLEAYGDEE